MREKCIEHNLVKQVRSMGGLALKFISPGFGGVPDRIVLFPGNRLGLIETKASGKIMKPLQIKRKRQLEALGFRVYCIDSREQIGEVLDEIRTT